MGVLDLERLADQVVDEIDDRAVHVLQRDLVDQHARAVPLDDEVVLLPGSLHVEAYWKPEQPPPLTLIRSIEPAGSPAMISSMRRAARSVRVTRS